MLVSAVQQSESVIHTHAAAAKSLQLCPTLCDPIDSSPPGSIIPGILQARILEWVATSFSDARKWKVKVKSRSCVWLLATPGLQPTRLLYTKEKRTMTYASYSPMIQKYNMCLYICTHISAHFKILSQISNYRVLSRVPCAVQKILISYLQYFINSSVYISIPVSQFIIPPFPGNQP